MSAAEFEEYMESYASNFDLFKDKVVFHHGYQKIANFPRWKGQETFTGTI